MDTQNVIFKKKHYLDGVYNLKPFYHYVLFFAVCLCEEFEPIQTHPTIDYVNVYAPLLTQKIFSHNTYITFKK